MANEMKQWMREELTRVFDEIDSFVLVDFSGLDSEATLEMRRTVRAKELTLRVIRNRIAKRAFADLGLDGLDPFLLGQTAALFGGQDPVDLTKAASELSGNNFQIKGGLVEGQAVTADDVIAISKTPPRPVLLSQIIGLVQAPVVGVIRCAAGPVQSMVNVVAAAADDKS